MLTYLDNCLIDGVHLMRNHHNFIKILVPTFVLTPSLSGRGIACSAVFFVKSALVGREIFIVREVSTESLSSADGVIN